VDGAEVVDVVRQLGIEIAERVVRQRCEMNDRIEARQVRRLDIANVPAQVRHVRHPVGERRG
jgi:hypothetical protein